MAMNGDVLGDEIIAAIDAVVTAEFGEAPASDPRRAAIFHAIGRAIVSHITENLQITFRRDDGGIQRSTAAPAPTDGPESSVQLDPGNFD